MKATIEAVGRYLDGCHVEIRIGNMQSNAALVRKKREKWNEYLKQTGDPVAWPARTKEVMITQVNDDYGVIIIGEGWTAISYPCDNWRVYVGEHHSEPDSRKHQYYYECDRQNKTTTGWSNESCN